MVPRLAETEVTKQWWPYRSNNKIPRTHLKHAELSQKAVDENRCDADRPRETKTMKRLRARSSNVACCSICRASVWMRRLDRSFTNAPLIASCWMCALVHIPSTDDQVTLGLSAWKAIAFSQPWNCSEV